MPRLDRNSGKHWTFKDVARLRQLVADNTPVRSIAFKLGRTPAAVRRKANLLGIPLKNRSPKEQSLRATL
jgi:hypothetical protein